MSSVVIVKLLRYQKHWILG